MDREPDTTSAPEGFERANIGGRFALDNGPVYVRWTGTHLLFGFRVEARHVNPGNQCHGGMLGMFADIMLSTAAQYQTDIPRQFLPTISLQMDFIAAAPFGSWVQGAPTSCASRATSSFHKGSSRPTARWCCARAACFVAGRCCRNRKATRRSRSPITAPTRS